MIITSSSGNGQLVRQVLNQMKKLDMVYFEKVYVKTKSYSMKFFVTLWFSHEDLKSLKISSTIFSMETSMDILIYMNIMMNHHN